MVYKIILVITSDCESGNKKAFTLTDFSPVSHFYTP